VFQKHRPTAASAKGASFNERNNNVLCLANAIGSNLVVPMQFRTLKIKLLEVCFSFSEEAQVDPKEQS
jgi:hypothetical protein